MDTPVSAADANRQFSELLRHVREEHISYVITSQGKPVARIVPVREIDDAEADRREAAKREWLARLAQLPVQHIGKWTREELYER